MAARTIQEQGGWAQPGLTSEQVWQAVARASFAVLSHVTPAGEPRSSSVVYKVFGRRLVVAVAPASWKAQHIAADGRVAVTVLVRRGGILSLVAPIPPRPSAFTGRRWCIRPDRQRPARCWTNWGPRPWAASGLG
jgi:Pyridoxamine 5'-phosphate oxidase